MIFVVVPLWIDTLSLLLTHTLFKFLSLWLCNMALVPSNVDAQNSNPFDRFYNAPWTVYDVDSCWIWCIFCVLHHMISGVFFILTLICMCQNSGNVVGLRLIRRHYITQWHHWVAKTANFRLNKHFVLEIPEKSMSVIKSVFVEHTTVMRTVFTVTADK